MLNKLFSIFSSDTTRNEPEVTQVINVYDAVLAHRAWKTRLIEYLEGRSTEDLQPGKICKDNLCVLGKWIHSNGKVQFGEQSVFIKLVGEHAQFHVHAAKVVEAHQGGNDELAVEILKGSFNEQSRKTVFCLTKLHALVEEHEKKNQ